MASVPVPTPASSCLARPRRRRPIRTRKRSSNRSLRTARSPHRSVPTPAPRPRRTPGPAGTCTWSFIHPARRRRASSRVRTPAFPRAKGTSPGATTGNAEWPVSRALRRHSDLHWRRCHRDRLRRRDLASHEFVEGATDPFPYTDVAYGITDPSNPWVFLDGEVADLCRARHDPGRQLRRPARLVEQRRENWRLALYTGVFATVLRRIGFAIDGPDGRRGRKGHLHGHGFLHVIRRALVFASRRRLRQLQPDRRSRDGDDRQRPDHNPHGRRPRRNPGSRLCRHLRRFVQCGRRTVRLARGCRRSLSRGEPIPRARPRTTVGQAGGPREPVTQ